jgi:hypothetical protein
MSKYLVFYLEVAFLLVIPVILLTMSSRFLATRHVFMAIGGIYCAYRLLRSEATMVSLGIHKAQFVIALKDIILPSILIVLMTFFIFYFLPFNYLKLINGYDSLPIISLVDRLMAYVFLSSPIQELIFRGYITWRIAQVFSSVRVIEALSVALFTFAHIPFYSPLIIFITFLMGIVYIRNYQKYQNLFAPIISHSVVGACLIIIRNIWFPYI